jgi:hypothetical protein
MLPLLMICEPSSVSEPGHFDTVPVPNFYFPLYSSGSDSLHNFRKIKKFKFIFIHISIETVRKFFILT